MEEDYNIESEICLFGLVGRSLQHSFSKTYFDAKFDKLKLENFSYQLFELVTIKEVGSLVQRNPNLCGFNVTIPYKQLIIPYLETLDASAAAIGAVNTVKIVDGKLHGFNTDYHGFLTSLSYFLADANMPLTAIVLGTGGSSKAVCSVLRGLRIDYTLISRKPSNKQVLSYDDIPSLMSTHRLIINTTPIGMYPEIEGVLSFPFQLANVSHYFFDLIYNPSETNFLRLAKAQGAKTQNGMQMLELQADKAWDIWLKD